MRDLRGAGPEFRLRDIFDYFAGTSTGAIIAAFLALGRSATEIRDFYLQDGPAMFERASLWRILRSGFSHKYDHEDLSAILQKEFSEDSILDLKNKGIIGLKGDRVFTLLDSELPHHLSL